MSLSIRQSILATAFVVAGIAAAPSIALAAPSVVIKQADVQQLVKKPHVKLIDVRTAEQFAKGHIAGAINIPWQKLNVSERDGIRNEYEDDAAIEKVLSEAGISYNDTLVLYAETALVGRAYVVLDYAGFDNLRVLDTGISKWTGALSKEATPVTPTTFKLSKKKENRVEIDYVRSKVGAKDAVIVDARELAPALDGHIPSAQLVPTTNFIDRKTLQVRDRQTLLKELEAKGITPDKTVVAYCGSGAAASSSFLFYKELGFKDVRFYDKSFDEWARSDQGQTLALENFVFGGDSLSAKDSLGPKFLNQKQVKELQAKGAVVVDIRHEGDYKVGRIPDSVNIFWRDSVDQNGRLKDAAELKALFAKQGVTPNKQVVLFGRGGLQLAQSFVVLKLLGYHNVYAFEGNWDGWVNPAYGPAKKG